MTRRLTGLLLSAMVVLVGAARGLTGTTGHAFAQSTERDMYVSVLSEAGAPVTGLTAVAFIVREDGARREVLRARPATEPIDIAVVVDNSQAATPHVRDLRDGLLTFIQQMRRGNRIALVTMGDRPSVVVDYTQDLTQLTRGVERLFAQPGSGAYVLDAIIEVAKGIRKRDAARAVILLVTTEGPEFSNRHYDQVLEPLRASGAALHALVLSSGPTEELVSDEARNRDVVLDRGTRLSGGRRDTLLTSMALSSKLGEVAAELSHQYRITYARPPSLIPPETIEVGVTRPGLTARGTLIQRRPGA